MKSFTSSLIIVFFLLPHVASARFIENTSKPSSRNYENVYDKEAARRAQFLTPKQEPEISWKTVCHPTGDYCFDYPDTWNMKRVGPTSIHIRPIPKNVADEQGGLISFQSEPTSSTGDTLEIEKVFLNRATLFPSNSPQVFLPSFSLISSEDVSFLDVTARRIEFTSEVKSVKHHTIALLFVREGQFHMIIYGSPLENYDADISIYERMVASIEAKKSALPTISTKQSTATESATPGASLRARAEARRNARIQALLDRVEERRQQRLQRRGLGQN